MLFLTDVDTQAPPLAVRSFHPHVPGASPNTIGAGWGGILKYLEAGAQLFGLGMHLCICIMASREFPSGVFAKNRTTNQKVITWHTGAGLGGGGCNVPYWNGCHSKESQQQRATMLCILLSSDDTNSLGKHVALWMLR